MIPCWLKPKKRCSVWQQLIVADCEFGNFQTNFCAFHTAPRVDLLANAYIALCNCVLNLGCFRSRYASFIFNYIIVEITLFLHFSSQFLAGCRPR